MNAELDRLDTIRREALARYEALKEQAFKAQQEFSAASQAFSAACEKDREDFTSHPMWQEGPTESRMIKNRMTDPIAA